MATVYVITNTINGKKYVGVTTGSINKRFNEHIRDSRKERCNDRPLYSDINQYGVENFTIQELEQCDDLDRFERESYWIDALDTHNNGYNFTYGGTGKQLYDYRAIANKYIELGCVTKVCEFYCCDPQTVRNACEYYEINITTAQEHNKLEHSKQVAMLDKTNGYILTIFQSIKDAARYLGDIRKGQHITEVCKGQRKSAYGYKWMFVS